MPVWQRMRHECGADTAVIETRERGDAIYRRRKCVLCGERFSTVERRVERAAAPPVDVDKGVVAAKVAAPPVEAVRTPSKAAKRRAARHWMEDQEDDGDSWIEELRIRVGSEREGE